MLLVLLDELLCTNSFNEFKHRQGAQICEQGHQVLGDTCSKQFMHENHDVHAGAVLSLSLHEK